MLNEITFDDLLLSHWIKFKYDTKDSYLNRKDHFYFKIENSIHYKCLLNNDFSDYENLITSTKQLEHSIDKFLKLKDEFDVDKLLLDENKIIIKKDMGGNKYIVFDGCHRLAIIMYRGLHDNNKLNPNWFKVDISKNKK